MRFSGLASDSVLRVCTQLSCRLNVDVVVTAADANDDAKSFELLQVLSGQGDGVIHHGPHRLVQHLQAHKQPGKCDQVKKWGLG